MNKQQVIEFLQKAGIWVKDGQIAKSDVAKAKMVLQSARNEAKADSPEETRLHLQLKKMLDDVMEADTNIVKIYHEASEYNSNLKSSNRQDLNPKEDEVARKIRAHLEAILDNVKKTLDIV